MDDLLITPGDYLMNRLTAISGNIDSDKLMPSIWISQTVHVKRILGKSLYDKIVADFSNDTLTGIYKEIFEEYVTNMLIFHSAADFISKNVIIISNGGNFKHQPDNSQIVDYKEVDRLSKHYADLANHFELQFYDFMRKQNIPEFKRPIDLDAFNFPWQI